MFFFVHLRLHLAPAAVRAELLTFEDAGAVQFQRAALVLTGAILIIDAAFGRDLRSLPDHHI